MKWVTRQHVHIDRTASAWLIRTHIDPAAEFAFVPAGTDPAALDGHTFDMRGAEFGHAGQRCTFEALLDRYQLAGDPTLAEMGATIREADVPPVRTRRPEAAGLAALLTGFLDTVPDDAERLQATAPLYDALHAYCRRKVAARATGQSQAAAKATSRPRLSYGRRIAAHLDHDD